MMDSLTFYWTKMSAILYSKTPKAIYEMKTTFKKIPFIPLFHESLIIIVNIDLHA